MPSREISFVYLACFLKFSPLVGYSGAFIADGYASPVESRSSDIGSRSQSCLDARFSLLGDEALSGGLMSTKCWEWFKRPSWRSWRGVWQCVGAGEAEIIVQKDWNSTQKLGSVNFQPAQARRTSYMRLSLVELTFPVAAYNVLRFRQDNMMCNAMLQIQLYKVQGRSQRA